MPTIDIETIHLATGAHEENGVGCMIEWASRLAGEPWSDHPKCVSKVIGEFCRSWNDSIADQETRDRLLKPYLTKVLNTNTGAADERVRSWMATDWLARVQAPAWLRFAGLTDDADALAACGEIRDAKSAKAAQGVLDRASANARAAGAAADAAWAAAGAAARPAAAAAWDAARAAAWAAAGAAADAAWADAWDAARAAAGAAARAAAWAAAGDAAAAAWDAAGAAARAAAGAALTPTVAALQVSACELLDRMCAVGRGR